MSTLQDTIHTALLAALLKHGESKYGTVASFDPVAFETRVTGVYRLSFVSEDVARAVQAKLDADKLCP